ncbi:hypothetical protein K2173_012824 [Erythroxylum novogranatense]|uniref:Phorbol-ester/DAG-type domain-containing protein n=1 Tax=Erythroxylum novogranatense TaxID=1862640 RepID=A0AAV8S6F3_9ROSI|nr:hypothetical protein K2173_012824 [Erythroxylum novogranatense]
MKYSEISHYYHPHHTLKFEYSEFPFKCDGCKQVGIGSRYRCSFCDFDLHMHCAIPSSSIYHPFYTKCSFQFFSKPPGDKPRFCNACERDVTGFVYHCKDCGFDLHPCCAKLPMVLDDGDIKLYLYRKVSASCQKCGRKGRSWSYRSSCKKYNLHVACVKDMLVENWDQFYSARSDLGKNMNSTTSRRLDNRIPSLKSTLQAPPKKSKGKVKKCAEVAGLAMQFVVSAVLGDPTALVAGFVASLF